MFFFGQQVFNKLGRVIAVALCLVACRTISLEPSVDLSQPGWKVRQGQALWKPNLDAPEIAGEVLLASHIDGRTFLQFSKTPLPILTVWWAETTWQIHFASENRKLSGRGTPSSRLGWAHLARAWTGIPAAAAFTFTQPDDNRWILTNHSTGEMISGFLTP